jgi:hypothetical protein
MRKRALVALAAGLLTVPTVIAVTALPASATTTITVANAHDSGAGSLRQAFDDASQGGAHENSDVTISIPSSVGNISLTSGELQYDGGAGNSHSLTVNGSGQTISSASSGGMDVGGSGTLTVTDMNIAISAGAGDGIFSAEHVVADHLTVTGADEGIIAEGTSMVLTNSQVTDSVRTGVEALGNITLTNSTVAGNHRFGIDTNDSGDAIVTNSTVSNNATEATFSGINATNAILKYATIVGNGTNTNDHNIDVSGKITAFGSVIAGQGHGNDCAFNVLTTSQGYNRADDSSCHFSGTGDEEGSSVSTGLGSLGNNGGPTSTRVPQTGSALIDAIPTSSCASGVATDQRGVTRPQGNGCDIGAVEVAAATPPTTPPGSGSSAPPASAVSAQPSLTG